MTARGRERSTAIGRRWRGGEGHLTNVSTRFAEAAPPMRYALSFTPCVRRRSSDPPSSSNNTHSHLRGERRAPRRPIEG